MIACAFGECHAPITLDLARRGAVAASVTVMTSAAWPPAGGSGFVLRVPQTESLELRVPFTAAPFNGTQLNAQVNGRRLLPYFAFGGDTRYDAVKGKPGMRPPIADHRGALGHPRRLAAQRGTTS